MSNIGTWLASVGLQRHEALFENVPEETFLSLQMTEYEKYGISTIEDKQRLFRLLKKLTKNNGKAPALPVSSTTVSRAHEHATNTLTAKTTCLAEKTRDEYGSGLLDLEADDGDLLFEAQGVNLIESSLSDINSVDIVTKQQQKPNAMVGSSTNSFPFVRGPPPPKIRVVVRKRPINKKEKERGEDDIMTVDMAKGELIVNEPKLRVDLTRYTEKHRFVFDDALAEGVTNDDVYRSTVQPLVQTLFWGGKATCFAYGQTGSGKTYTMTPLPLKSADEIFTILSHREFKNFYLYVSCFEIYGGKVFDLLNSRKKLEIREDSKRRVVVVGLKEFAVDSLDFIQALIHRASSTRSTGTTGANTDSSRSHSIMQFAIKKGNKAGVSLVGKISFIDLAGSERGADTCDNNRQTRLEGAEINKSLLALKECIRALDCEARHVPFRGSKLTAVLRDSFVGKEARTVMIANVSPNSLSVEHSLNTLRYADRVKELRKEKHERSTSLVTPGKALPMGYSNTTIEEETKPELDPFIDPVAQEDIKQRTTTVPRSMSMGQPSIRRNETTSSTSYQMKRSSNRIMNERQFVHSQTMDCRVKPPATTTSTNTNPNQRLDEEYVHEQLISKDSSAADVSNILEYSEDDILYEDEEDYDDSALVTPPPASSVPPAQSNDPRHPLNDVQLGPEELMAQHEDVMNDILDGEEVVIEGHRLMIEKLMGLVKEEMNMLSEVDQPGSAIDKYIERLDSLLAEKSRLISSMQRKVDDFKAKLGQEEQLNQVLGDLRKQK